MTTKKFNINTLTTNEQKINWLKGIAEATLWNIKENERLAGIVPTMKWQNECKKKVREYSAEYNDLLDKIARLEAGLDVELTNNQQEKTTLKDNKVFEETCEKLRGVENPAPGLVKVARAWDTSTERYNLDELMIGSDLMHFESTFEAKQAVNLMQRAKLESFVLADKSTALMDEIHFFTEAGARFEKPVVLSVTNKWGETEEVKGIRFTL